jgi:hypothetical protein
MPRPEVFVFGESHSPTHVLPRGLDEPLAAVSAATLNGILEESPHVIFVEAGLLRDAAAHTDLMERGEEFSETVGLAPVGPGRDFEFLFSCLPVALASLAMAPESRCAVLLNSARVREAGGFRDVDSPVRELVVRLSSSDSSSVALLERPVPVAVRVSSELDPLPPIDANLPLVAPQWPPSSHRWLASALSSLQIQAALPGVASIIEATALHAGLWQTNDWLDESHNCSQSIEGEGEGNGDYWHAIMHRREPDPSNSKYWFRRVGHHACFEPLGKVAAVALDESGSLDAASWKKRLGAPGGWDSSAFVDLSQATDRGGDASLAQAARRIQWAEMLILLAHTARSAT